MTDKWDLHDFTSAREFVQGDILFPQMTGFRKPFRLVGVALLVCIVVLSQQSRQSATLSNEDILKLILSGIRTEAIVQIVKSTPGQYDGSEQSLSDLRRHGASDEVIQAVRQRLITPGAAAAQPPASRSQRSELLSRFERTPPPAIGGVSSSNAAATLSFNMRATSIEPESCAGESFGDTLECHDAHKAGCSHSDNPKYDAYLNYLKNRLVVSGSPQELTREQIDSVESNLPDTLTSRNHAQHAAELADLGEGNPYTVVGTLYYAISTDSETCNCQMSGSEDVVDFHIGIGFDSFPLSSAQLSQLRTGKFRTDRQLNQLLTGAEVHQLEKDAFVVEMTPHYRAKHAQDGWTLDRVLHSIGKKVRVTGQLMVDNAHMNAKDDCGLGPTDTCWRRSVWELHPVTGFDVCADTNCSSVAGNWIPLGQVP